MRWPPDIIDKIRSSHDLVEWVGRDTILKSQSGGQYTGLCPFADHNEKTPSFSVSSDKQVYHCFGCSRGGDIFTYFREQKGMSFPDTVKYLAEKSGISLAHNFSQTADNRKTGDDYKINELALKFFHQNLLDLPAAHAANKYLAERGYSKDIIQKFKLGYAPPKGGLSSLFEGEKKKRAAALGLLAQGERGSYDMFRHRLIFPIISPLRQTLGFGGRCLDSSLPKYINSRDSFYFHKGRVLYGLNESAGFIRQLGYALLVEGYTDFLTLYQSGFKNSVAVLGTALTAHHSRLIKRYTNKVILFFDGDEAGGKAAVRSLPLLLEQRLRVYGVSLKDMDPDECVSKKGAEFLKTMLAQSADLFLSLFSRKITAAKNTERLEVMREAGNVLSAVKDESVKEYYESRLLDAFVPSEKKAAEFALKKGKNDGLNRDFRLKNEKENKKPSSAASFQNQTAVTEEKEVLRRLSLKSIPKPELYLLVLALHREAYLIYIASKLKLDELSSLDLRNIFSTIFDQYEKNKSAFNRLLVKITGVVEPEYWLQAEAHPILAGLLEEDSGLKFIDDCLNRGAVKFEHTKLKNLMLQLKLDPSSAKKYLKQIQDIKKNILSMERGYEK